MAEEKIKLTQYSKGGGCGCKIAPSVLQQILATESKFQSANLLVGNESSDDAAVYQLNEDLCVISTTDFFLPIVDDAFDFGRIASANAISDIYAMGGTPLMAIAILGWPIDKIPMESAKEVLEGARAICREAGIPLAGGHTIDSSDPVFGLAVTGTVATKNLKRNNTAREGDLLFLTKPIGVGVMATAVKRKVIDEKHYPVLIQQLSTLNKLGEVLGRMEGVHAMTDVTGFGLLGHMIEMAEGSGLAAELKYDKVKKINGLDVYLGHKTIPDATTRNWNSYGNKVKFEKGINVMEAFNVLPDPQTNGGLLIAVAPSEVETLKDLFRENGLDDFADPIGRITAKQEKVITVM